MAGLETPVYRKKEVLFIAKNKKLISEKFYRRNIYAPKYCNHIMIDILTIIAYTIVIQE